MSDAKLLHVDALCDVLEQLPQSDLLRGFWHPLTLVNAGHDSDVVGPHSKAGRAFRLVSHGAMRLACQLTRRARLLCSYAEDGDLAENGLQVAHGNFLAHSDGLEHLSLFDGLDDSLGLDSNAPKDSFAKTLLLGGVHRRALQVLDICNVCPAERRLGDAIHLCCPRLRKLKLCVVDNRPVPGLPSEFFTPLRSCPLLTEIEIHHNKDVLNMDAAVRALGALPHLRTVTLGGSLYAYRELESLTTLTDLCQLSLSNMWVHINMDEGARLGALFGSMTQLTVLEAPHMDFRGPGTDAGATEEQFVNALVAQLSGLQRLTSLVLDGTFEHAAPPFLAAGFATVQQLSALTRLSTTAISPPAGTSAGHRPSLQSLQFSRPCSTVEVAAALQPLLPLPALRALTCVVDLSRTPDEGEPGPGTSAQATAAAWQAATLVANAPNLQRVDLTLDAFHLPLLFSGVLSGVLVPLRACLTKLSLERLPLGAVEVVWPLLCTARCLESLAFYRCHVAECVLQALGAGLEGLRHLGVDRCTGCLGTAP